MDWVWKKRIIEESDWAIDRRDLRRKRRPRTRRKENSARASRRPVRRARVTSLKIRCLLRELTSSPTALVAASDSGSLGICLLAP